MNSFSCWLSGKPFFSLVILNYFFRKNIFSWKFSSFSTSNISCHSLLTCSGCWKICSLFYEDSLYVTSCFPLATFNILSSSLTLDILLMCLGMGFMGSSYWTFWIWMSVSFFRLGKFSAIFSRFLPLSLFFWEPYNRILIHLMLSINPLSYLQFVFVGELHHCPVTELTDPFFFMLSAIETF